MSDVCKHGFVLIVMCVGVDSEIIVLGLELDICCFVSRVYMIGLHLRIGQPQRFANHASSE